MKLFLFGPRYARLRIERTERKNVGEKGREKIRVLACIAYESFFIIFEMQLFMRASKMND